MRHRKYMEPFGVEHKEHMLKQMGDWANDLRNDGGRVISVVVVPGTPNAWYVFYEDNVSRPTIRPVPCVPESTDDLELLKKRPR